MRRIFIIWLLALFLIPTASAAPTTFLYDSFQVNTINYVNRWNNDTTNNGLVIARNGQLELNLTGSRSWAGILTNQSFSQMGVNVTINITYQSQGGAGAGTNDILFADSAAHINSVILISNPSVSNITVEYLNDTAVTVYTNGGSANVVSLTYNGTVNNSYLWMRSNFAGGDSFTAFKFHYVYSADHGKGFNITRNSPLNGSSTLQSNLPANITVTPLFFTFNTTNVTLFVWNATGILVNQTTRTLTGSTTNNTLINATGLSIGRYFWNAQACGTNSSSTFCAFSGPNFTYDVGFTINSETWNNITSELSTQLFTLNISVPASLSSSLGTLIYNGTRYIGTITVEGNNRIFSRTITTPDVTTERNISFNWEVQLTDGGTNFLFNTVTHNQTVRPISIDNCTVNNVLLFNYTLFDEGTRDKLSGNTTIQLNIVLSAIGNTSANTTFFQVYNGTNPALVCITPEILNTTTFRVDSVAQYYADNRVVEFYYIQNFTLNNNSIPQHIGLYDLLITDSQEFIITFLDSNRLPVSGALIEIIRQYIGINQNLIVEVPKTDINGKTPAHLVLSDVVYNINVKKEGQLLASYENQRVACQDLSIGKCEILLVAGDSAGGIPDFTNTGNLSYYSLYNETTRTFTFTYLSLDGLSRNIVLNMTLWDNYLNTSLCLQTQTAPSGTLSCVVPAQYFNSTILVSVTSNSQLILSRIFSATISNDEILGATRYILAILIIIALPLIGISSQPLAILFFFIGLILVGLLNLVDYGGFFGPGSAFIFILIAGGILLFKALKRESI